MVWFPCFVAVAATFSVCASILSFVQFPNVFLCCVLDSKLVRVHVPIEDKFIVSFRIKTKPENGNGNTNYCYSPT